MSDENLPDPGDEEPARSWLRDARIVLWALFQLVVLLPLVALCCVALVLVPLALYLYVLYQGLGVVGTIAAVVLHVSVLRLLALFSRWCSRHRP
ncbi:hypothetical protein [Streptomyces sp. NBC_01601]|uniref:hypothetical protein n=1 Tax=Streptomyces sp. NBC_01601 TaxID=2975892 RepID=UPI002E2C696C|nr:hypothetical protein [Streptomyces sp. NBC_01601]